MSEPIENLMLEHLRRFQAGHERIKRRLESVWCNDPDTLHPANRTEFLPPTCVPDCAVGW